MREGGVGGGGNVGASAGDGEGDDDLAKAIKLSKEEEEHRRRELEASNAASLFDDSPTQTQPQATGFNGGYTQGSQVDWFANPVDQNNMQQQSQPTGYMQNAYTGYQQPQATGFPNQFNNNNAFGAQPTGMDPYGQQQQQQQQSNMTGFQQPQPTGYNPWATNNQQQQQPMQQQSTMQSPTAQPGNNNPWATNSQQSMKPTPTGSNNPFAQQSNRPSSANPTMNSLGALPEQKTLQNFGQPQQQPMPLQHTQSFPQQPSFNNNQQPQKDLSEHETKLNSLLAGGDGMDTYGNTGNLRMPAQHTAPGTFVNSAGSGMNRLQPEATGNNPFMRQQFTGMPSVQYGGGNQGIPPVPPLPTGMNGQGSNNPFGQQQQPQKQNQDLIQF